MDIATTAPEIEVLKAPSQAKLKEIAGELDFSKPLVWDEPECMSEWYALVRKPPLHSVVVHIEPVMAAQILRVANEKNRRLQDRYAQRMAKTIASENYELTGDTIKFAKGSGRLLDGQHRLKACEKQGSPIITHMVFGLEEDIFDVLDQGKRRSAADVLGLCGIEYATIVTGAVRWVMWYQDGGRSTDEAGSTRAIKEAALGPMKGITEWTRDASQIHAAYKHPPSMMTGVLYLIGKHNRQLAKDFAHAWLLGGRLGRNKNFDVLEARLLQIRQQSGGHLNNMVRAALIITTFNHWNAGIVVSPRALTYRKEWKFPEFEFDPAKFQRVRTNAENMDTSLKTSQMRILNVMIEHAKGTEVQINQADLAREANVALRQLPDILRTLIESKEIAVVKTGHGAQPTVYRITAFDKKK